MSLALHNYGVITPFSLFNLSTFDLETSLGVDSKKYLKDFCTEFYIEFISILRLLFEKLFMNS